jgi:uncharacterized protein YjlB
MTQPDTFTSPQTFTFRDDGAIPNSKLPLLVYRQAVPADAASIERIFTQHRWPAAWRSGVHPFHHFHSDAHEVLGVASGSAKVQFGGPEGEVLEVSAGDVVVVPAGVGHCNREHSPDLLIVGAYPDNSASHDLRRGKPAEHDEAVRNIAAVPLPPADPVSGETGPLTRIWSA